MKTQNPIAKIRSILRYGKLPITQEYLADISGYGTAYIKQLETDRSPITRSVARAISECTGVDEEWLLIGDVNAPILNRRGRPYSLEDFDNAQRHIIEGRDPDPLATRGFAFQYAIRVERMIRLLGQQGKDHLLRTPLSAKLEKLEKKFGFSTLNTGDKLNDGHWTVEGADWEWGAETLSERFCEWQKQIEEEVQEKVRRELEEMGQEVPADHKPISYLLHLQRA